MKKVWLGVALLMLGILLSGCAFEYSTVIKSDQSGTFSVGFSYTDDEIEYILESLGTTDASTICNDLFADEMETYPPGTDFRQERKGEENWCYVDSHFADLQELRSLYGDSVTVNRLEVVDGTLYYDVSYNAGDVDSVGAFVDWKVTLPGNILTQNASLVNGSTLTWNEEDENGMIHMQASSSIASNNWIWWAGGALLCLCLVVVVIAAVVLVIVLAKKKKKTSQ